MTAVTSPSVCGVRISIVTVLAAAAVSTVWLAPPAEATPTGQTTYRFQTAVRHLVLARQTHQTSYERDQEFGDWIDQGHECDTRAIVLQDESTVPVT